MYNNKIDYLIQKVWNGTGDSYTYYILHGYSENRIRVDFILTDFETHTYRYWLKNTHVQCTVL